MAVTSFLIVVLFKHPYQYSAGLILIAISSYYSFKELNKRIGLKDILADYFKKKNK